MFNFKRHQTTLSQEDWTVYRAAAQDVTYEHVYKAVHEMLGPNSSRRSCLFGKNTTDDGGGYHVPLYTWDDAPEIVVQLRDQVQRITKSKPFDYCLVHLYASGDSTIGWHNDGEALYAPVVSLSLGAARKFRFRPLGSTKGHTYQYILCSGDIVVMHDTCQRKWEHGVPVEKGVREPRINITFRYH